MLSKVIPRLYILYYLVTILAQYNFKTNDKDVIDFLGQAQNKSQVIVESLKEKRMSLIKPQQTRKPLKTLNIRDKRVLKVLEI